MDDANGEWIELYNNGTAPVDLNGWQMDTAGHGTHTIANGAPLIINPGEYLVLGNNDDPATNGGVTIDYSYGNDISLPNGFVELCMNDGGTEFAYFSNISNGPYPMAEGSSVELAHHDIPVDVGANWALSTAAYGAGDMGTPGAQNATFLTAGPITNLVITEIMMNPAAVTDDNGEWFEITNAGNYSINLFYIKSATRSVHSIPLFRFSPSTLANISCWDSTLIRPPMAA